MKKIAIILMNLGGPDSLSSVKPFLFNLFYDKAIIRLPNPLRWLVAKIISTSREKYSQNIYSKIGGKSPILEETQKQKEALEKLISSCDNNFESKVLIYMKYSYPMAQDVASMVREYQPDEVMLLPLYPHYSTTTTESSIKEIEKYLEGFVIKKICCYHDFEPFIDAHVENMKSEISKIKDFSKTILLFSAHSIPEKFVKQGDPYQFQIENSVAAIMGKIAIPKLEYKVTYQSKVGPAKWLTPSTDQEVLDASKAKKAIYIVPISFVSEHVETLVELDIDYKNLADQNGASSYFRFKTLSVSQKYIESLYKMILNLSGIESDCIIPGSNRICSPKHSSCACLQS